MGTHKSNVPCGLFLFCDLALVNGDTSSSFIIFVCFVWGTCGTVCSSDFSVHFFPLSCSLPRLKVLMGLGLSPTAVRPLLCISVTFRRRGFCTFSLATGSRGCRVVALGRSCQVQLTLKLGVSWQRKHLQNCYPRPPEKPLLLCTVSGDPGTREHAFFLVPG